MEQAWLLMASTWGDCLSKQSLVLIALFIRVNIKFNLSAVWDLPEVKVRLICTVGRLDFIGANWAQWEWGGGWCLAGNLHGFNIVLVVHFGVCVRASPIPFSRLRSAAIAFTGVGAAAWALVGVRPAPISIQGGNAGARVCSGSHQPSHAGCGHCERGLKNELLMKIITCNKNM